MNTTVASAGSDTKQSELFFHPNFDKRKPGDVILKAEDDDTCFYFDLPTLKVFSSFFRDLPPPSKSDMYNDTSVITLPRSTNIGLRVYLDILRSTVEGISGSSIASSYDIEAVINAVLLARMYDTPWVSCRLLESATADDSHLLCFAILSLSGEDNDMKVAHTAVGTLDEPLSCMEAYMENMLAEHAPNRWRQLKDFHLRYSIGMVQLHAQIASDACILPCGDCEHLGIEPDAAHKTIAALRTAFTWPEVQRLYKDASDCRNCQGQLDSWIGDLLQRYSFFRAAEDFAAGSIL